ncbi:MAG: hypothetical protein RBR21_03250 [Bacteroidales bacterium]|nr:hypothetical protein [Bacteroidales bacterium]
MIKMAINMIGQDTITEAIAGFLKDAIAEKQKIELQPDEVDTIGILYNKLDTVYFAPATITAENHLIRIMEPVPIESFVNKLLNENEQ